MRLEKLSLKNIGPFYNADISFVKENSDINSPSVTIITGENGSGKTIILDAIRALFYGINQSKGIERIIYSDPLNFALNLSYFQDGVLKSLSAQKAASHNKYWLETNDWTISQQFNDNSQYPATWIFDYWTSKLATDSFAVTSLTAISPTGYLKNALSGSHQNVEVSKLIVFFDYLKSSDSEIERKTGIALFNHLKKIISLSLNNGEFSHVSRSNLQPIIKQGSKEISLDKLSSGNLYLIQRLVALLGQAYAVYQLNKDNPEFNKDLSNITHVPGVLMIDEAENHLHPKWQKTFIKNILEIFPNLQIIVTTHSPFIVSSVSDASIYVCESKDDHSVINNLTDYYVNMPIDEILTTDLFKTEPFSDKISKVIENRKTAIIEGNKELVDELEKQLVEINPQYFSFFEIDKILQDIKRRSA